VKLPHILMIAAYCTFLFWLSSGPVSAPASVQFDGMDKVAHMCAYGLLAGLVFYGLRQSGRPWTPRAMLWFPVLFVALYGGSDEFHQYFIPSRSCDVVDWLADVTGAFGVASLLVLLFRRPVQEPLASPGE
jgi:VanZ family protein